MSNDDPVKQGHPSAWLCTAGIALATPFLVWFAIGDLSFPGTGGLFLDYGYGPYQVGPESGYVVGGAAAVVAAVSIADLVFRTRQGIADRWSWAVVAALVVAGALAAAGWRTMTAGGRGANIGGGLVLLFGPVLLAGLLALAVSLAGGGGRQRLRRTGPLTLAAALVAPALYVGLFALTLYDDAAGFITPGQYAVVGIGQTRSEVHERLGRKGGDLTNLFFQPAAPGLLCDFYKETTRNVGYRFCFRAGVLVSKDLGGPLYAN